jgi:hypothetical protein
MAFHGKPRYTGDLDVFVSPSRDNGTRLLAALGDFGAPVGNVSLDDLMTKGTTISIGTPPRRIDILNWMSGLDWQDASADTVQGNLGPVPVRYLSLRAWKINKAATGREKDQEDLREL